MRQLQRLLEHLEALTQGRHGEAPGPRFLLVPGGADAEPGAATAEHVERGGGLDPEPGLAIVDAADHEAEAGAPVEWAAMKPSAVMPSSIGSSGLPTEPIWRKWSMTQMESKPASSAVRTMSAKRVSRWRRRRRAR